MNEREITCFTLSTLKDSVHGVGLQHDLDGLGLLFPRPRLYSRIHPGDSTGRLWLEPRNQHARSRRSPFPFFLEERGLLIFRNRLRRQCQMSNVQGVDYEAGWSGTVPEPLVKPKRCNRFSLRLRPAPYVLCRLPGI